MGFTQAADLWLEDHVAPGPATPDRFHRRAGTALANFGSGELRVTQCATTSGLSTTARGI